MSARVVSDAAFIAALEAAHRVRFSAYVLSAGSAVAHALERACDAGAEVDVLLEGVPYGRNPGVIRANAGTARELQRHGAHARMSDAREPDVHMKAAIVDGTAYLDDRNWAAVDRDTIVALDDTGSVAALDAAFDGRPATQGQLATEKQCAVALEAQLIREAAGDRIDVETESFGATIVSTALAERVAGGTHMRLLVCDAELRGKSGARERSALAKLAAAGVQIESTARTEKLCIAAGQGWVGSANATFSPKPTLDWGLRTSDPALVFALGGAFERNWAAGRPLSAA